MRFYRLTLPALAAMAVVPLVAWLNPPADDAAASRLPGTRPVIDAAGYPSLQAAIDALGEQGGVVRVPPGTFEIDQPLVIASSDVLLQGAGTATHIHNSNTAGQPAISIRPASYNPDRPDGWHRQEKLWRVRINDLRITGNPESGHGIEAILVNEIFIEAVTVSEHGGDGIRLDWCYEDPRVCDSLITYNKQVGVNAIGCHDIVVSANQFEENNDALHCIDGFNLCMTGNNIDDHLGHGVVIENTYGSVVSGNMIEECQGTGIVLDRDCYGITLSANVIAHDFSGGIDLRDAHGCSISGNSFPLCGEKSGYALRVGPDSGRLTINGNHFADSEIGGGRKRPDVQNPASGVLLAGGSDLNISGNSFSGLATKAVTVEGEVRRVLFTGNLLSDVDSDHAELAESVIESNLLSAASGQ